MQLLGNVIRNWRVAFEKSASLENSKWLDQNFKGRGGEGKVKVCLLPWGKKINSQCWLKYTYLTMFIKTVRIESPV